MSDTSHIEDLLDRWEELRECGEAISIDEFVQRYCPDLGQDERDLLQQKIAALESMDRLLGIHEDRTGADVETARRGTTDDLNKLQLFAGAEPVAGYRLVSRLGEGGFGEVWKAEGPGGFNVALKFVRLDRSASESELRSLELVKRLRHPNLLTTIGSWQRDGWLIIASELVGQSLQDRLDALRKQGESGLPRTELLAYMRDAAKALDYLNKPQHPLADGTKGSIQHRDIKPRNLLLSGGGLKVADLGIARLLATNTTGHTGAMSVAYAAPEFFEEQTSDRSDQYSLAVTYCQLRGGRLPFEGNDIQIMKGHVEGEPDLSMIPAEERPAVLRALAKDPEKRWSNCRAFVTALESAEGRTGFPPPDLANYPVGRWLVPGIVAAVLLALGVMGIDLLIDDDRDHQKTVASNETFSDAVSENDPEESANADNTSPTLNSVAESPGVAESESRLTITSADNISPLTAPRPPNLVARTDATDSTAPVKPQFEMIQEFVGHTISIRGVAFSPDGKQVLSCGLDHVVRLWDVETGTEVEFFRGHTQTIHRVAFFPDGRTAVSASYDQTLRTWKIESGKQIQVFKTAGDPRAVAISPDGHQIISGTRSRENGVIQIWQLGTPQEIRRFQTTAPIWSLAISPDGQSLVTGTSQGQVEFRDLSSGKARRIGSHADVVTSVKFLPDGESVIARSVDGKIRLWNVSNGKLIREMEGGEGHGRLAITPDGRHCLSAGKETTFWNLQSGELLDHIPHETFSFDVSIGPEGKLALISVDNKILLWKLPTSVN